LFAKKNYPSEEILCHPEVIHPVLTAVGATAATAAAITAVLLTAAAPTARPAVMEVIAVAATAVIILSL
jgi:quinolinate synthase